MSSMKAVPQNEKKNQIYMQPYAQSFKIYFIVFCLNDIWFCTVFFKILTMDLSVLIMV